MVPPKPGPRWVPDDKLQLLFDPTLIPEDVRKELDEKYHIRPLSISDYYRGYLEVLSSLTSAQDTGWRSWSTRFNELQAAKGTYYVVVVVEKNNDRLVACGTLLMEMKFQREMGKAAHIEDVVVDPDLRGSGLGKVLMNALTKLGERLGAYKTILDCRDQNVAFYEKCGFVKYGLQMKKYS